MIRHYPVNPALLDMAKGLTEGVNKADYRLFTHMLADSLRRAKRLERQTMPGSDGGGWISLRRRLIDDGFYIGKGRNRLRACPKRLESLDLIEIHPQYKQGAASRKYRIPPPLMEAFHQALLADPIDTDRPVFDLVTGKPWQAKWNQTTPSDPEAALDTPPMGDLVERAVDTIRECHYNRKALTAHLESRRLECNATTENEENRLRGLRLRQRLINDLSIFRELPPVSPFRPHYRRQRSGRIGTPMQNLTIEAKAAAYRDVPQLHNYDLSNSQLRICAYYEFPEHGVECPWLIDYLNKPELKNTYAEQIGITPTAFKEAVIGVVMGSRLPRDATDKASSILVALDEGLTSDNLNEGVQTFRGTISPLKQALDRWHRAIIQEIRAKGKLENALGLTLTREAVAEHAGSKRGVVAAHLLQGREALFIHTLTSLSERYGFQVIGNEHDGLITIGIIPESAIQQTQKVTGLHRLELREKPFGNSSI